MNSCNTDIFFLATTIICSLSTLNISFLSCLQSVKSCHFEFYIQFAFLCLIFHFTDECMQQYANYCKVHRSLFMLFAKEKNQKKVNLIC